MTTRQARSMQWICFVTMALNGLYATSGSLVMPLLRAQYSLSYDMGGMLLSALNFGNLLTSFVCGVLAGRIGRKSAVLLLTAGSYAILYGIAVVCVIQIYAFVDDRQIILRPGMIHFLLYC